VKEAKPDLLYDDGPTHQFFEIYSCEKNFSVVRPVNVSAAKAGGSVNGDLP